MPAELTKLSFQRRFLRGKAAKQPLHLEKLQFRTLFYYFYLYIFILIQAKEATPLHPRLPVFAPAHI